MSTCLPAHRSVDDCTGACCTHKSTSTYKAHDHSGDVEHDVRISKRVSPPHPHNVQHMMERQENQTVPDVPLWHYQTHELCCNLDYLRHSPHTVEAANDFMV